MMSLKRCTLRRRSMVLVLTRPVAQVVRVDAVLEVGASTESVTVEVVAPLLKTESGELSRGWIDSAHHCAVAICAGSGVLPSR